MKTKTKYNKNKQHKQTKPTGVMDDLDTIVDLGSKVAKNKLSYSFRGIFGGQR